MADYLQFNIYVPRIFKVEKLDETGQLGFTPHHLPPEFVDKFVSATTERFGGFTQAHPRSPTLFKGWWKQKTERGHRVLVDHLTYFFGLVRVDEDEDAIEFFRDWQRQITTEFGEDVVLVTYHPVQTLGDYF